MNNLKFQEHLLFLGITLPQNCIIDSSVGLACVSTAFTTHSSITAVAKSEELKDASLLHVP